MKKEMGKIRQIHGVSGTLLARQPNEPSEAAAPDSNLEGYGDVYTVRDLRKRAKKEPTEVKALNTQNLDIKLSEKAPRNYNPDITIDTPGYKSLYFRYKDDDSPIRVELDYKIAKTGRYGSYFADLKVDFEKIYNWEQKNYSNVNTYGIIETAYYNKLIDGWLPEYFDGIVNAKTGSGALVDFDRRKELAKSFVDSILPLGSQEVQNKVLEKYKKTFYKRYQEKAAAGLGKPTIKLEFENNDDLQQFFKDHEENLIDSYVEDATISDDEPDTSRRRLNGLAGQNPDKYNYKISDLKCEGMQPTYKKLKDYGHLIGKASGKNIFCGFGFDNTEKLLISKVVDNYKSVAPLAAHLKGDSERQSAFNVWYWLHENIRYNYDAPGAEEIRSPARAWADRKSGVDCDCLAVFTYCLLLAMGYKPQFEIVAFKDTWAHIYVNLNGLAVDRVLNKFGARPPLIQKKKMLEVPVYSLEGCDINAALSGLEATVLKKIENGTATKRDCCDYRKAQCLKRFSGNPVEQKVMAMFMPYVYDVDPTDGAIYFYGQPIATAARQIDRMLQEVAMTHKNSLSGLSEAELNGIFKKIGSALKKAATATVKAVAAPVKAAVKVTTSAVKATTNAVKATANVVKAGVQAATGNKEGAKETIQKAGEQAKAAVVNPTKDAVNITKETVKETVVDPTVTAVRATVEIVKVILVKLNPVTVLMRNALRALVAINFLGIANRLLYGKQMYQAQPARAAFKAEGYTDDELDRMLKAFERVDKFYTKMGGDRNKMWDAITKGYKRKALFKGGYKNTDVINDDDTLSGLGEPLTIGACLAAVGSFFASIWKWIKNIIPKGVNWIVNNKETIADTAKTVSTVVTAVNDMKNGSSATDTPPATAEVEVDNTAVTEGGNSGKIWLLVAAAAAFVGFAASGKKKKKK